ncbi:MAG TPA: AAA family ATPase [Devosia sp.]|jgi:energy-coupling factor transporter ATP-binding protein EcfA2|uniref:AAA family ATPase n=1 Tax=Devosia sp. TaxID=1871048 RepID=UPI002DDD2FBF|nr:AAA family ATPase [Devosia sp.]HEV2514168.1 AAA family ATPase [Devosia sp.]
MAFEHGQILILSGSPGSGKSTVAAAVAAQGGSRKVHLHTDDFWGFIRHGHIEPWLPEAGAQNRTVMAVAAAAAERYAMGDFFTLVDGVIGPWFVEAFTGLGVPTHYVVLRTALDDAIARCRQRGGDTLSDPAVVAALHAQFADLGEFERHALDVTGLSPGEVVGRVERAVQGGEYVL